MVTSICAILLGLYCLLIAPRYYPMIGFRGVLYYLKTKNSWSVTNKVFGLFLIASGVIYLINTDIKIFVLFIVFGLFTTDLISSILLKKVAKKVI